MHFNKIGVKKQISDYAIHSITICKGIRCPIRNRKMILFVMRTYRSLQEQVSSQCVDPKISPYQALVMQIEEVLIQLD